jgi:hypothetical protein
VQGGSPGVLPIFADILDSLVVLMFRNVSDILVYEEI